MVRKLTLPINSAGVWLGEALFIAGKQDNLDSFCGCPGERWEVTPNLVHWWGFQGNICNRYLDIRCELAGENIWVIICIPNVRCAWLYPREVWMVFSENKWTMWSLWKLTCKTKVVNLGVLAHQDSTNSCRKCLKSLVNVIDATNHLFFKITKFKFMISIKFQVIAKLLTIKNLLPSQQQPPINPLSVFPGSPRCFLNLSPGVYPSCSSYLTL